MVRNALGSVVLLALLPGPFLISSSSAQEAAALASQVKELFRVRCLECHGGSKTNAGVKILDRELLLRKKKVVPGKPDDSPLYQAITAGDESVMPPAGQPALNEQEKDAVRRWIAAGAPAFPADAGKPDETKREAAFKDVSGVDYVLKRILAHVRDARPEDMPYLRYFSINHILMAGATPAELELQRDALAKAINHLSWEGTLVRPRAIDPPADSILVIDIRQLGWHLQPFERIKDGKSIGKSPLNLFDLVLLEYPFGLAYEDSETWERLLREYTVPAGLVRPIPYVRADWFVSTITQPTLYEDLLQLPFTLKELEARLGVDSDANLANGIARRAGLAVSGVSRNNRVVERHPLRSWRGSYWKSFDFKSSKGPENIFKDPIQLHPTGGEMIFNLPNGLQGYLVADGKGNRVEAAPTDIVTDKFAEDRTVRNGLSCMRCHDQGMKGFADAVRPALLRLPGLPGFDKRLALQLYPEAKVMDGLLKEDGERFLKALAKALGKPQGREPLIPVSHRYLDEPLSLTTAAGELGLNDPAGLEAVFRAPQFTVLGLVPLTAQGVIRRDSWEDYFDLIVSSMGLALPLPAVDGVIRRDFPAGTAPVNVELKTSKRSNTFEPGEEMRIQVTNKGKAAVFIELIGTNSKGRKRILTQVIKVEPGQTYAYPPEGEPALKSKATLGKEQITLFASDTAFPAGELLRGKGVTDRVVHAFWTVERKDGRTRVIQNPARLVKKTIDVETR